MRNEVQWWLENWQAMHGGPEVNFHEFNGAGRTFVPLVKDDSYLTTSICFLRVQGNGKPNLDRLSTTGLTYLGGGWFFYPIEIKLGTTKEELYAALDSAKAHLLAGVKDHDKSMDVKS